VNILGKLSLNQKLLMAAVILWVPSFVQLWQAVATQNAAIDLAELELQGVNYAAGLGTVMGPIADHRGLADLTISGDRSRSQAISASADRVESAMTAVTKLDQEADPRLHNGKEWIDLTEQWHALRQQATTLPAQENDRRHIALLEQLRVLHTRVVTQSNLLFSSQGASYYLVDAALLQVPRIEMDIFALRGALSAVNGLKQLPHAVRGDLAAKSARVSENAEAIKAAVEKLAALLPSAGAALRAAVGKHVDTATDFSGIVEDGLILTEHAQGIGTEAFELGTKSYETASGLNDVLVPLLQQELHARLSAASWTRNLSLFGGGALLLVTLLIARALRLHINKGAGAIVTAIERIAGGEIGYQTFVQSSDEFGRVLSAVNRLDSKLVEVVASMRTTTDTVGSVCKELAIGNDHLGDRTQQQAASIEETASSMEEMTATVKQNAANAQQADRLVAGAQQEAERGGATVQRAVDAMREINTSSKRIADIIGVIDEIAFQTNLLALNAAVEAARAGEQGRGFAVVATEVRNLAQRSAGAAKEIKELINDSVQKVDGGAVLVNESGKVLTGIMDSVRRASVVVAEIAAASGEQSAGIEQVNTVIAQLDSSTQENAALVEEGAAASKSMQQQAEKLVLQMSYFRARRDAIASVAASSSQSAPPGVDANTVALRAPVARQAKPAMTAAAHAPLKRASGDGAWQDF